MDWGKLFFSAYGRIRRQDFWVAFFILLGVLFLLGWLPPIWLAALYCSICIRSKRLHDMGRSGWLQVIPWIVYAVATVISVYFVMAAIFTGGNFDNFNEFAAAMGIVFGGLTVVFAWCVALLVDLGFLLWIGFSEGEPQDNRFGPLPIGYQPPYSPAV